MVAGHIEGVVLRAGQPVEGARIWYCRDSELARHEKDCKEVAGTWTDRFGRFSFRMITGSVPQPCSGAACGIFDPGWAYWFLLEIKREKVYLWRGGLGYGRPYAKIACELTRSEMRPPFEKCSVEQEKSLEYR